jgi:glycosyltransferase involved in cell wall biosynthesis
MHVLHWYPNLYTGGGVANAVTGLAKAQARLGTVVAIAAARPRGRARTAPPGLSEGPSVLSWRPTWLLASGSLVLRGLSAADRDRLCDFRPDVVHVHGEFNPDNLRIPSLFPCPKVLSPHGAFHPVVLAGNRTLKTLYVALARRVLYGKVVFHALSPLEESHIQGVSPGSRVFVCPNGPSPRMEKYIDDCVDSPVEAAPHVPVVFLYAGRLDVFRKGLDIMLDAFAVARQRRPEEEMILILAGADFAGGKGELQRRARRLGIEDAVRIPGFLEEDELARAYAGADVYLQLSRNEAFSLSVADALLFGKPVILGDGVGNGSYPQINGLSHVAVVAPDVQKVSQALTDAVRNIESRTRAALESRTRIRSFLSWNSVAERTLEAYQDLL